VPNQAAEEAEEWQILILDIKPFLWRRCFVLVEHSFPAKRFVHIHRNPGLQDGPLTFPSSAAMDIKPFLWRRCFVLVEHSFPAKRFVHIHRNPGLQEWATHLPIFSRNPHLQPQSSSPRQPNLLLLLPSYHSSIQKGD
jgi:hypothetical protein